MRQARYGSSIATVVTSAAAAFLFSATPAFAYDAVVGWSPVTGTASYKVYVGADGASFAAPVNVGKPAAESDGVIRVVVENLPLGPDLRFAVTAVNSSGVESDLSNELEITYADAARVLDSDDDGLTDAQEDKNLNGRVDSGETNPDDADSDNDGLKDGAEVENRGTDPLDADSDNDGIDDGDEVTAGTDPNDPASGPDCGNGEVEGNEECDDGNTSNDDGCLGNCQAADCTPGDGKCGDGNSCTTDSCSNGRCVNSNNTNTCNDGIACTNGDRCSAGSCRGTDSCEAGSQCMADSGQCEAAAPVDGRWIPAATYPSALFRGDMTVDVRYAGGTDADGSADSIAPLLVFADTTSSTFDSGSGDETIYTINIPESGRWYLWGRLYYPGTDNDANSFFVRVDDGTALKFGNNKDFFREWHWDGDGNVETGAGRPLDLGVLAAGSHRLILEKREAGGVESPRLDVIFLTSDATAVPTDEAAEVALDVCPQGVCEGDEPAYVCGDATGDGIITVVDAWSILTASIAIAQTCGLAVCDVDGSDAVNATDALMALHAAVGVGGETLACEPTVAFEVGNASKLTSVEFVVDYSATGASFGTRPAQIKCTASLPRSTDELTVTNDATSEQLSIAIGFSEPLSGNIDAVECRFEDNDGLPVPAAFVITVNDYTRVGGRTTATIPEVAPTVVLP
jgi:cysteine-rich repeat protein